MKESKVSCNLCIDCKHHAKPIVLHLCTRVKKVNPVDGSCLVITCESERSEYGTCGVDGRHFIKKGEQNES